MENAVRPGRHGNSPPALETPPRRRAGFFGKRNERDRSRVDFHTSPQRWPEPVALVTATPGGKGRCGSDGRNILTVAEAASVAAASMRGSCSRLGLHTAHHAAPPRRQGEESAADNGEKPKHRHSTNIIALLAACDKLFSPDSERARSHVAKPDGVGFETPCVFPGKIGGWRSRRRKKRRIHAG